MCFASKSSSQAVPPPAAPTTFDYTVANRNQVAADGKVSSAQAAKQVATTQPFGSELGSATMPTGGQ